jgi:transglutaminase-like putative cysteine protease/predicted glutamine amidotransferase
MCDFYLLSFDSLSSPTVNIKFDENNEEQQTKAWGIGWYPNRDQAAIVTKHTITRDNQALINTVSDWRSFRSTTFICNISDPLKGFKQTEAQPFARSFAARDWIFTHHGNLDKIRLEKLYKNRSRLLEPLGHTDSELAFSYLLSKVKESDARKLSHLKPVDLLCLFNELDTLGSADMALTDGLTLVCYHSKHSDKEIYYQRFKPTCNIKIFDTNNAIFAMDDPRDCHHTILLVSSSPLAPDNCSTLQPGQLIIIKRATIVWNNLIHLKEDEKKALQKKTSIAVRATQNKHVKQAIPQENNTLLDYRIYDVEHITHYKYSKKVHRSTHILRLLPVEDSIQNILTSDLNISAEGEEIRYEDVFGNHSVYYSITTPYKELYIDSKTRIKVCAAPPDDHSLSQRRSSIPLIWMPWQRQMMQAYLMPNELPESQLMELTDYAMSFVERNDYNILHTLEDMNITIYQDFDYVQGATSLGTTPFEVYVSRQGVCQDFANLMICLARLLGIPARYRMGYLYTGNNYENKIQADASHAWIEVFLPYVGWRGYDPTNGCNAWQDHIRVACGRNFIDATPTSGTLYKGGDKETLSVIVRIKQVSTDDSSN